MNITGNVGRVLAASVGSLVLLGAAESAHSSPGDTELISSNASGAAVTGNSPTISADGRFVAFLSEARDIAPGPASGFQEVFVRDQLTGVMERITVGLAGEPSYGGYSDPPGFSADGRYVVFPSSAANLVPNDTEGTSDIFVRDRTTQQNRAG